jgi:hypoxanthine phosphoribosyltransferase
MTDTAVIHDDPSGTNNDDDAVTEHGDSGISHLPKKEAPDGKIYFSYSEIHATITSLVPQLEAFQPTLMIAIGGGGFIPARILRTQLKVPIVAVSLELYDDNTNSIRETGVQCLQWFDVSEKPGSFAQNGNVLIVDEVDDSRTTLQFCVEQVLQRCSPKRIAVAVVHNKLKVKKGVLPSHVEYFAGADVPDKWNCYPWDAAAYGRDIEAHEALSRECSGLPK